MNVYILSGGVFMTTLINNYSAKSLLIMDATEIAKLIQENKLTSVFITEVYINHIKKINPTLNAVVETRFEKALSEAKSCDNETNTIKRNLPLFGVPISIKESFDVQGMHTTGGIVHRKDIVKTEDAVAVRRLRHAGAIILGKTNTPALCFSQETTNKLFGRTNNSWNVKHTAGGSSGGEATLISTGASAVGLASDIGGSIRFPSHFSGVVGFKPGAFQVSETGHFPETVIEHQKHMLGIGPIGKSVRDMRLIYHLITDKNSNKSLYKKMAIDVLPINNGYPLDDATSNLLTELKEFLISDYEATESIPPYFDDTAQLWQEIMSIDGAEHIKKMAFNTDQINVWTAYLKEKLTHKTNTSTDLSWAIIGANMFKPSSKRLKEVEDILKHGHRGIDHHLDGRLLVFPVHHTSAPKHGELYKEIFSITKSYLKYLPYVTYANVWGLPSLTVPIGFDENNLPIGIQIMGKVGNEDSIFKLGQIIEEKFKGYQRSTIND